MDNIDKSDPSLALTLPVQLTRTLHRQPYDYILPEHNPQPGKIIVITGGGSGIGAAAANVWVRAGAEGVVIAGRRGAKLRETAAKLEAVAADAAAAGGDGARTAVTRVMAVTTDVTVSEEVERLFGEIRRVFGRPPDVVLASAGMGAPTPKMMGEDPVENWWNIHEVNVKGVYATIHHFIRCQDDPAAPKGTVVVVNSMACGVIVPGVSGYSTSKYVAQRLIEYLDSEYPSLRAFSILPGAVTTEMTAEAYKYLSQDDAELTGMVALWLVSPKSEFLRGQLVGVNWDLPELEQYAQKIAEEKLLKSHWIPVLPAGGGKGLP